MVKIRVLKINGDNIDIERCKIDKNNVTIGKETKEFSSSQVFRLGAKKAGQVIKRRACLLFNTGKNSFYTIKDAEGDELEGVTNKDRKKYVDKQIADALSEAKPMSNAMFFVLLGVGILNIVIMILAMRS